MSAEATTPNVAITYCRLCGWLLRASWMAQELLTTFAEELGSVTLIPDDTGGVFEIRLDGKLLWSRKEHGRFPDIKELKQLVRDEVAPERSDPRPGYPHAFPFSRWVPSCRDRNFSQHAGRPPTVAPRFRNTGEPNATGVRSRLWTPLHRGRLA
jgi:selenoprotein W-related protein